MNIAFRSDGAQALRYYIETPMRSLNQIICFATYLCLLVAWPLFPRAADHARPDTVTADGGRYYRRGCVPASTGALRPVVHDS